MRILGNIVWFIFGGFISGLLWALCGLLWCITIIGIPVGKQCLKFAVLSLTPFGRNIVPSFGTGSILLNVLWILFGGIELAASSFAMGVACCATIIGIPFGIQHFKMAILALMPFGTQID